MVAGPQCPPCHRGAIRSGSYRRTSRRKPRRSPVLLLGFLCACEAEPPGAAAGRTAGSAAQPAPAPAPVIRGDSLAGDRLAAALGCGACHPGAPAPAEARLHAPDLGGLAGRWEPAALAAYLQNPAPRTASLGRMPDFRLDAAEAAAVTLHLLRTAPSRRARRELRELARAHGGVTPERGAAIVAALNCAGCHEGTGVEAWSPAPPVASIGERVRPAWLTGYLADPVAVRPFGYYPGSGSRMPDFDLSAAEVDSLATWLAGGRPRDGAGSGAPLSPFRAAKAETLLRDHLSCLGCHALGGEGGRVAPALDGAGARLRPGYLRRVIREPGMAGPGTIMPAPLEDSATLELVTRYLAGRASQPTGGYLSLIGAEPRLPDRSPRRDPPALYGAYCAPCHGPRGAGDGFNAAHLPARPTRHADPAHMSTRSDATLLDGIHGGGHILGRSHRMAGYGATLSAGELRGVVAHLRDLCACEQPAWAVAP